MLQQENLEEDIVQCLKVLQSGGIILYPTDTVWGIGCDATQQAAVEKIIRLKQRASSKSFVVLVASEKEIYKYVPNVNPLVFNYLEQAAKPVTVIYNNAVGLAPGVMAADGSVAIRICKEAFCKQLIKRFRKPLVSTSANFSGEKTPACFQEIDKALIREVDYVVKYKQNDTTPAKPSTIVRWEQGQLQIVRP
jgi:L-threonylcarbamoyladenylate synthase